MKKYELLKVPADSAWERWSIRRYLPIWVNSFCDGIKNLWVWFPTIFNDRNYDHGFIYDILEKKIELQRKYLVSSNRHMAIHRDNYYMTVALNLIQAERDGFYEMEYMDYQETRWDFIPTDETKKLFTMESTLLSERHNEYLTKYPLVMKRVLAENPELVADNGKLCHVIARVNQERCRELLFKILKDKMSHWWD